MIPRAIRRSEVAGITHLDHAALSPPAPGCVSPWRRSTLSDESNPDPFLMGYRAYLRGDTIDQCPPLDDPSSRCAWIDGWEFGKLACACSEGLPHEDTPPKPT